MGVLTFTDKEVTLKWSPTGCSKMNEVSDLKKPSQVATRQFDIKLLIRKYHYLNSKLVLLYYNISPLMTFQNA